MQDTNHRQRVLELLTWVRDEGLWPERFTGEDLFVVPITNVLIKFRHLNPQHRSIALWVPGGEAMKKALAKKGFDSLFTFEQCGIHFVEFHKSEGLHRGIGVEPRVALLSALQAMRRKELLVV